MRLVMYKRLSSVSDAEELEELQIEMIDRFGQLPRPLSLLFQQSRLRLACRTLGIRKVDATINSGRLEFNSQTRVDTMSLVELVQQDPKRYQLGNNNQLQFRHDCEQAEKRLEFVSSLLGKIQLTERQAA